MFSSIFDSRVTRGIVTDICKLFFTMDNKGNDLLSTEINREVNVNCVVYTARIKN